MSGVDNERKKVSRRRLLKYGVAGVAAVAVAGVGGYLLLGGSKPAQEVSTQTSSTQTRIIRGGKLTGAFGGDIDQLEPQAQTSPTELVAKTNLYNKLWRYDKNALIVGDLAKTWDISPDGKTYTISLVQGVKFHDGTTFDANSLKWNITRYLTDPALTGNLIDNGDKANIALVLDPSGVEVVDQYNAKLILKVPGPELINAFTRLSGMGIASEAANNLYGTADYWKHAIGTGPFKFVEWRQGSFLRLARNPDFFRNGEDGKPLPYLDELVLQVIPDNNTRVTALQTGEIDFIQGFPSQFLPVAYADPNLKVIDQKGLEYMMFALNNPPFDDKRIRQAVNYALDRQALVNLAAPGVATPSTALTSPLLKDYTSGKVQSVYQYNPAMAKQLLQEAGQSNLNFKLTTTSDFPVLPELAVAIQSQLAKVGVTMEIETLLTTEFFNKMWGTKTAQAFIWRWVGAATSAYLYYIALDKSQWCCYGLGAAYNVQQITQLINQAYVEVDPQTRKSMYDRLEAMAADEAALTSICWFDNVDVTRQNIQGYNVLPTNHLYIETVMKTTTPT